MDQEALRRTLTGPDVWFFSRSRQELWHKGETSGNYIKVKSIWKNCENNSLLIKAHPVGPTCHTGNTTCFFRQLNEQDDED